MHILPFLNTRKSRIISSYEGEDRVVYRQTNVYDICMLADGHGGSSVSTFLSQNFCNLFDLLYRSLCHCHTGSVDDKISFNKLSKKLKTQIIELENKYEKEFLDYQDIIKRLLKLTISELAYTQKNKIDGSTLVGFVRILDYIITFNIGDSRCYALDNKCTQVKLLTHDHNLNSKKERKRLNTNLKITSSILPPPRLDGILMMTRSIGDCDVPRAIARPDIFIYKSENYSLLALVSDGTYEYINKDVFKHVLRQSLNNSYKKSYISNELNDACSHSSDDRSHLLYIL